MCMNWKYGTSCLQGKTAGKSSGRKSFSVLSAPLTDCHYGVKVHVGKRSERRDGGLVLVLVGSDRARQAE